MRRGTTQNYSERYGSTKSQFHFPLTTLEDKLPPLDENFYLLMAGLIY